MEATKKRLRLKINPKDNTITIKKVKDSWTREEIKLLSETAFWAGYENGSLTSEKAMQIIDKWIEKNIN